jgi:Ca2+-binding EF-hand superfamily protein
MMNRLRMNAAVTGALLGTLFAGIAVAGESAAPPADARAQREALVNAFFERMDTNKDAQVTRLEAELASRSLFAKLDGNGDGEITKAEAESAARAARKEELTAHFKTLDANRDGRLTVEEAKLPAAFFEQLDADKDRSVVLEEFQAMPEMGGARQQLEFDRADLNHDGKVTRDEGGRSAQERFDLIDTNKDSLITRPELEARVDAMMKGGAKRAAPVAPPH